MIIIISIIATAVITLSFCIEIFSVLESFSFILLFIFFRFYFVCILTSICNFFYSFTSSILTPINIGDATEKSADCLELTGEVRRCRWHLKILESSLKVYFIHCNLKCICIMGNCFLIDL
jgi:hypothetical protein